MVKRMIGIIASKEDVRYVIVEVPEDKAEPLVILEDGNWKVQSGDRSEAYQVLHQQCVDYVKENDIDEAVVQASAVMGKGSAKLGLLLSAEVRGIVIAATATACPVKQVSKGIVSKTYGDRKVDDYIKDDDFWDQHITGENLRRMSRGVAMLLISVRNT